MSDDGGSTVLVIEDDGELRGALELMLGRAGIEPVMRSDGRSGLRALHELRPDAVVLDVGLPDIDGWAVLERIRDLSDVPVMMLTARNLELDKVRGLQAGADDYLTKPFGNLELVARLQALVRRAAPRGEPAADELVDDANGLRIDLDARRASVDGHDVALTPLEWRILVELVRNKGRVLSPQYLIEHAWRDPVTANPERVKFAMRRLRKKLGERVRIENVRGFGYRI